jgi:hypothetical protein
MGLAHRSMQISLDSRGPAAAGALDPLALNKQIQRLETDFRHALRALATSDQVVRQAKPGPTGKEDENATLKVGEEVQRVEVPPAQSLASRAVASLAWLGGDSGCEA